MALDTRFACHRYSTPQNPNPIREGGCSGGKRHHAIAGAPSPPRRVSTAPAVAAPERIFSAGHAMEGLRAR